MTKRHTNLLNKFFLVILLLVVSGCEKPWQAAETELASKTSEPNTVAALTQCTSGRFINNEGQNVEFACSCPEMSGSSWVSVGGGCYHRLAAISDGQGVACTRGSFFTPQLAEIEYACQCANLVGPGWVSVGSGCFHREKTSVNPPVVVTPPPVVTPPSVVTPPPVITPPPPSSEAFTYDEVLPDMLSTFVKLRPGQTTLANFHVREITGMVGPRFPTTWGVLAAGTSVRLKLLVPPGVSLVGWYVEAASKAGSFGGCDENGNSCSSFGYEPVLWPVGYNANTPGAVPTSQLQALTHPKIVYLTVKAEAIAFQFMSMTVSYTIKDQGLYEAWRAQRRWAGGMGDCDGLEGAFCK